jgi:hypothetical protein
MNFGRVLFPLRYDIIAQGNIFKECVEKFPLELKQFAAATEDTVMIDHLEALTDMHLEAGSFADRGAHWRKRRIERYHLGNLRKLLKIYKSVKKDGWQPYGSLTFKSLTDPTHTKTILGVVAPDCLFLTNGQHRCTVLWALGYRTLSEDMWAASPRDNSFVPLDTTEYYIRRGLMTERDYVKFARLRFKVPPNISKVRELLGWARFSEQPDWLARFIRFHWRKR